MAIHGKFLDQNIRFQLIFMVMLFSKMEKQNGLIQRFLIEIESNRIVFGYIYI